MQRLPTFEANILNPVLRAIEDDRSIEDIAGIIEEIEMFACPVCGHIAPDHRWTEPFNCLADSCMCPSLPTNWADDPEYEAAEANLISEIRAIITGRAA